VVVSAVSLWILAIRAAWPAEEGAKRLTSGQETKAFEVGRYGNVEDGVPLIPEGGPTKPWSHGGDEVALYHAPYVATHTERCLFVADPGNTRILSVKLGYHETESIALSDVPDATGQ
jgi:hypothetical protein